jgi:hypothetical protein
MHLAHALADLCLRVRQLPFSRLRKVFSVEACSRRENLARHFGSDSAATVTD